MQQHAMFTEPTFMRHADVRPTGKPRGRPFHKLLVSFSAAYFTGALITDIVYLQIPDVLWERFSIWLIVAGLVMAGLAVVAYLIGLAGGGQIHRSSWPQAVGYALAVGLSVANAFVHSRDGYTAVVPTGLMLSALVVLVLLLTAWVGRALPNRQRVGV
jgi:uncharacterized membrane protein